MQTQEKQLMKIAAPHIHAGVFTLQNESTGTWKTFRIRTQKEDATFFPGKRIVSILKGCNNDPENGSWEGIGLLVEDYKGAGVFAPWKKWALTSEAKQCKFLIDLLEENWPHPNVTLHQMTFCLKCSRPLTTPESVTNGIGPECIKRVAF